MARKFKEAQFQLAYETILNRARNGEMVHKEQLVTGNSLTNGFWLGYHGAPTGGDPLGSQSDAAYLAGVDFRKETDVFVGLKTSSGKTIVDNVKEK
jgi:hypothetical protein